LKRLFLTVCIVSLWTAPASSQLQIPPDVVAINAALDGFHDAASKADGARYFKLFTDDAIYIGTDAAERWTVGEFRAFAEPYMSKGTGWTYRPRNRNVVLPKLDCGCVAWFDELLDSESYGTSRGTGVMMKKNGKWLIAQYALTFPIPNALSKGMTDEIKAFEAKKK
jgi:hypothetical protein